MSAVRIRAVIVEGELDAATIGMLRAAMESPEQTVVWARPSVSEIVQRVSYETGVATGAILGPLKGKGTVRARRAISWVAHRCGNKTLAQIGAALGDRDHTTIRLQVIKAEALRECDPAFLALTRKVAAHFENGGLA